MIKISRMIKILDPRFNHMMKVSQIPKSSITRQLLFGNLDCVMIISLFCDANDVYFEPNQTSTNKVFANVVNGF